MRVLIQRVSEASVEIGGKIHAQIGAGMLLLIGIEEADGDEDIEWLAGKIARLRIFDDEAGVMNLDIVQSGGVNNLDYVQIPGADLDNVQSSGRILAISQFTLHASTRRGNRPSYIRAARPETAKPLYEKFVARLSREIGPGEVKTGVFGADMKVALVNDGPVTIILDSKNRE